jgi:hypothetical protein
VVNIALAGNKGRNTIVYSCWLIKSQRSPFCNYYQGNIQSTWFYAPLPCTQVEGSAPKVDLDPQPNTTTSTIRLADNANKDVLGCCPNQPTIRSPCKQNCITRAKVRECGWPRTFWWEKFCFQVCKQCDVKGAGNWLRMFKFTSCRLVLF